jgi:membrane associated rhomboid family serine protease
VRCAKCAARSLCAALRGAVRSLGCALRASLAVRCAQAWLGCGLRGRFAVMYSVARGRCDGRLCRAVIASRSVKKSVVSSLPTRGVGVRAYTSRRAAWLNGEQVLWGLIGSNVAVWSLWHVSPPFSMLQHFTCSVDGVVRHHRLHTLLTCAFSHQSGWHLFSNMLGLYFFGGELLALLGPGVFLSMYLGAAVVSSAAQVVMFERQRSRSVLLGASGAVNSCISLSILLWPSRVVMVYGLVPVPAALFGVLIMFQDVAGAEQSFFNRVSSPVGYVSHLTGAAVGALVWSQRHRLPRF